MGPEVTQACGSQRPDPPSQTKPARSSLPVCSRRRVLCIAWPCAEGTAACGWKAGPGGLVWSRSSRPEARFQPLGKQGDGQAGDEAPGPASSGWCSGGGSGVLQGHRALVPYEDAPRAGGVSGRRRDPVTAEVAGSDRQRGQHRIPASLPAKPLLVGPLSPPRSRHPGLLRREGTSEAVWMGDGNDGGAGPRAERWAGARSLACLPHPPL